MWSATGGRAFERFINFSDGVTAVAITMLALPMVSIAMPADDETVWQLISQHWGEVLSYLITFIVVGVQWRVHARVFQSICAYDTVLFTMNLAWLTLIVVLPWPSTIYGHHGSSIHQGGEGFGGAGLFYWGMLTAISVLMSAIAIYAYRTPSLHVETHEEELPVAVVHKRGATRGLVLSVFFLILGVTSVFVPLASLYLPLLIIPMMIILNRLTNLRT